MPKLTIYETVAGFDIATKYGCIENAMNLKIEEDAHGLVKQLASFRKKVRS